tara:strand:+ start:1032 stop:1349 length:318 start_codon:yes stop_codon:yes gene_type:complete
MTNKQDRHGSPKDRGQADYYYGRLWSPHYYKGDSYTSELVQLKEMTAEEIKQYTEGYRDQLAGQKDWGYEDGLNGTAISEEGYQFNKEYEAIMNDVHEQITKKDE